MIRIVRIFQFSLICVAICSCRQLSRPVKDIKYILNLHLKNNVKYQYDISNESETEAELNDNKSKSSVKTDVGIINEIVADSNQSYQVKLTYNHFHILSEKQGGKNEIIVDKTYVGDDPSGRILKSLLGESVIFTIDAKNGIQSSPSNAALMKKMIISAPRTSVNSSQMMQDEFSQMVGQEFLKENLGQGYSAMPDTAVFLGESWQRKHLFSTDMKFNIVSDYTLVAVNKGIAEVSVRAVFKNTEENAKIQGYDVGSEIEGEETGIFLVDTETGVVLSDQSEMNMTGNIQILGRDVPVKIKVKKSVQSTKL